MPINDLVIPPIRSKKKLLVIQNAIQPNLVKEYSITKTIPSTIPLMKTAGDVSVQIKLNREYFTADEAVELSLFADTSACTKGIGYFQFILWRVLIFKLSAKHSTFQRFDDVLSEVKFQGIPAGEKKLLTYKYPLAHTTRIGNHCQGKNYLLTCIYRVQA